MAHGILLQRKIHDLPQLRIRAPRELVDLRIGMILGQQDEADDGLFILHMHGDPAGHHRHKAGIQLQYQKYELSRPKPLLREILDSDFESEHHRKFRVNRSLRDVEPSVNLLIRDLGGGWVQEPDP